MTMDFVYSDDPVLHYDAQVNFNSITNMFNDGRFLYPLWLNGPIAQVQRLAGFRYLRISLVFGIIVSSGLIYLLCGAGEELHYGLSAPIVAPQVPADTRRCRPRFSG